MTTALPRWDLSPAFGGPDAPELAELMTSLRRRLAELDQVLDESSDEDVAMVEDVLARANDAGRDLELITSYLHAWYAADTADTVAAAKLSDLNELAAVAAVTSVKVQARLGRIDVDAVVERSEVAHDHEHFLRNAAIAARHQMSLSEEELAARLRSGAGAAWERLRTDVASTLTASLDVDGEVKQRPISEIMNLAHHPDRDVRRRAYETEAYLWRVAAVPIAASLNGIKNESLVLAERRGWANPLDVALHQNQIDRPILDAMLSAMENVYGELRGHLRRRARMLGTDRIAWFDLIAPLGFPRTYSFEEARSLLFDTVAPLSPRLDDTLRRAFDERWVDAEPRTGKVGGAFCTEIFPDGPRILMNFDGTFNAVSTLAHEFGHAFHDICLGPRTHLQRPLPMTLAETASMFLQHMLEDLALDGAPDEEKLAILNLRLNEAVAVTLDLRSRFELERSGFTARRERALTVDELEGLTLRGHAIAFGDVLDPEYSAPHRWAAKPHYYIVDLAYYNFPYQFGLLFALGLYRRYLADPSTFAEPYERLLSRTGMATAAHLAADFDIDLRDEAFWASSLDSIRSDIRRFADLTPEAD